MVQRWCSTFELRFPSTHKRKDNQMVGNAVRVEDEAPEEVIFELNSGEEGREE